MVQFQSELNQQLASDPKAKPGFIHSPHRIVVHSLTLTESQTTQSCDGQSFSLHRVKVNVACTFFAPGMEESRTVTLEDAERAAEKAPEKG